MKHSFWEKRIPTILGLVILIIGIGLTTFLAGKSTNLRSIAGPSETPTDSRITNISDTSFTVSYTTADNVLGSVNYGRDNNFGKTALDDRDQEKNIPTPYTIHSITVKNLTPSTTYYFSIKSGANTFLQNNSPFTVTTGTVIQDTVPQKKSVNGKVILPDGSTPKEAIVYLASDETQTISSLVKGDGSYSIPLNFLRKKDLLSYFFPQKNTIYNLLVTGDNLSSKAKLSNLESDNLPTITLSNDYDFTQDANPIATQSSSFSSLPIQIYSPSSTKTEILTPKKDQGFVDQQPKFSGTAVPNSIIEITIHSDEGIQAQVTADANGNWSYRPPAPLSPGEHTISITIRDVSGILKTISQSFVVFASGEQITQSATPSATPVITQPPLSPIPTLEPIITIIPTAPPVISITPTTPPITPPGNSTAMTIGALGLLTAVAGVFLFLLTRGGISSL